MTDQTFWSYLAGFFDGEGHLTPTKGRGVVWGVCQSGERGRRVLEWIRNTLLTELGRTDGLRLVCRQRLNPRFKTEQVGWVLTIERREVIETVLKRTLPYLQVKKDLAQDTLRFWKLFPSRVHRSKLFNRFCPSGHPYADDNLAWNKAPNGERRWRRCRTCSRERASLARAR